MKNTHSYRVPPCAGLKSGRSATSVQDLTGPPVSVGPPWKLFIPAVIPPGSDSATQASGLSGVDYQGEDTPWALGRGDDFDVVNADVRIGGQRGHLAQNAPPVGHWDAQLREIHSAAAYAPPGPNDR